jgi:hypothetical protein
LGPWGKTVDFMRRIDAVKQGHADIQYGNIRILRTGEADGFTTIACFSDYGKSLVFEELAQALPEHGVVIYEDESGHFVTP